MSDSKRPKTLTLNLNVTLTQELTRVAKIVKLPVVVLAEQLLAVSLAAMSSAHTPTRKPARKTVGKSRR